MSPAALYKKWAPMRDIVLERARHHAKYSIPSAVPDDFKHDVGEIPTPYQGLGARGTRNLGSKLALVMLPPTESNFKMSPTPEMMRQLIDAALAAEGVSPSDSEATKGAEERTQGEVDLTMSLVEQLAMDSFETSSLPVSLSEVMRLLVIAGNCALFIEDEFDSSVWKLNQYVARRARNGKLLDLVVQEMVSPDELPEGFLDAMPQVEVIRDDDNIPEDLELYTHFQVRSGRMTVSQAIGEHPVPETEQTRSGEWPINEAPLIVPRMIAVSGEHYGRAYLEELMGDLMSLDGLNRHMIDGAAGMSKMLWMVDPAGTTKMRSLRAPNLAIIQGREQDVSTLRADKSADFSVSLAQAQVMERRLEQAFLLQSTVARNAERVTAEEIRQVASELDDALGGVYAVLSRELQLPMVTHRLALLRKNGSIPDFDDAAKPRLTTGLQALGRGHDLQKMRGFIGDLVNLMREKDSLEPVIELPEQVKRLAAAWGVNVHGLVKTMEQFNQANEEAQLQQTLGSPQAISQLIASQGGGAGAPAQ